MHRFGSVNPKDYDGGMSHLLAHAHSWRRENVEPSLGGIDVIGGQHTCSSVFNHLLKVGRPLEDEETRDIQTAVETFVRDLLQCVGMLEGRFINKVIPSGSVYEGTKVTTPNEFDFMAEIQVLSFRGISCAHWHSGFPGRPLVSIHPFLATILFPDLSDITRTTINGRIGCVVRPSSFHAAFRKTFETALAHIVLPSCFSRKIRIGEQGPAITLVLTWCGKKYRDLDVSIDITPAIKFFHWPEWSDLSGSKHIQASSKGKEQITKLGFHIVPTSPHWRASFSVAELHLMNRFSPDNNRLTCYRCAKYFRDQHDGDKYVLSSYMLKTAFFFEVERYPEDKFWTNELLFTRLKSVLDRILSETKEELFCSYFVSSFALDQNMYADFVPYAIKRITDDLNILLLVGPQALQNKIDDGF